MPAFRARDTATLLGLAIAAFAPAHAGPAIDHWQVRTTGSGDGRRVESISTINSGGAVRTAELDVAPVTRRGHGNATVSIHADPAARAALPRDLALLDRELDRAIDWLGRLAPMGRARTHILLTLVGDGRRLERRRVHAGTAATTIDIAAPLDPSAGTAPSAQLGRALATALHEASHATAHDLVPALSRDDDEYRASLVESCYLVDTLRPGDRLRLPDPAVAVAGEPWTAAASREASARVVAEFARAAGGREIAWNDRTALLGIRLLCRARLALPSPSKG